MSVAWACLYVGFGPMRAVVMFCLERIVSEAVSFIMAGFIETYLIGSTLVLPLISLWCYRKSIAIASGQGNVQTPGGAGPIPLKPALFMLFYSVAYAVADAGAGVHLTYPASLFALVPPTLFIALIALWPKCFKVSTLYFVACPAMMAAVMLPATLSVSPPQLVRSCMEVSYSTAVITEFLIVAELSYRLGIQPVWFFSIVRAFRYGGLLIGSALVSIVSSSPMHSLVFSVLIVSGVVIVSLMLVGERGENPNWGIVSREVGSMPKGEALETRVVETAGLFGLSEREEQVLSRLMHHMTVAAISQELMLAPGTVKAHVQHIYRKTNCHSRKELESLVLGKRA